MKHVLNRLWERKGNMDNLSSMYSTFCSAANEMGTNYDDGNKFNYDIIFEFLDPLVELKGAVNTIKRLDSYGLYHFISEISPEKNKDPSKILEFFQKLVVEDSSYAKAELMKFNVFLNPERRSEVNEFDFKLSFAIKANEIYLKETKDSPDYLWKANAKIAEYFRDNGVLNESNKEKALPTIMKLIKDEGLTKDKILSFSIPSSISTYFKNNSVEILEDIKGGNTFFNVGNSEVLHLALFAKNDELSKMVWDIDNDFFIKTDIRNSVRNSSSTPWVMSNSLIWKNVVKDSLRVENGSRFYEHIFKDLISSFKGSLDAQDIKELSQDYISLRLSGSVNSSNGTEQVQNLISSQIKNAKSDADVSKNLFNGILNDLYLKNAFHLTQSNSNLPSIHFFNTVDRVDINFDKDINSHITFLVQGGKIKDKLSSEDFAIFEEVEEFILNQTLKNMDVIKEKELMVLTAYLYKEENKERFAPIFNNTSFMSALAEGGIIHSSKKNTMYYHGELDKKDEKDYVNRIIDIFTLNPLAFANLRKENRNAIKNMLNTHEKQFTEAVVENPNKFYNIITSQKEISQYVFAFSVENNRRIMEKMLEVKIAGLYSPPVNSVDETFKI